MSKHTLLYLTIGLIIVGLLAAACQPSRRPVPTEAGGPPAATESPAQGTEPAGGEAAPENEAPPSDSGIPEDVPIPDSVYELQASRKGSFVQYKIDGEIADVVTFYQQQLPELGWQEGRAPDISQTRMGTMLREKENGDRLAINMQKNDLGGFVFVTITLHRAE
jgi:hypothetical protein